MTFNISNRILIGPPTHTEAEILGHHVGKLEDFERSEMLVEDL